MLVMAEHLKTREEAGMVDPTSLGLVVLRTCHNNERPSMAL